MKHVRALTSLIAVILVPFMSAAQALAATQSITQELHVTAVVPAHRDIIVDASGHIMEIVSNTPEDATPTVYEGAEGQPSAVRPLTDNIYADYRRIVPVGTAKTGVLYRYNPVTVAAVYQSIQPLQPPRVTPAGLGITASAKELPWQTSRGSGRLLFD